MGNGIASALWVLVAILALVVVMRLVAWDDYEVFAILNCLTAFVYLPAWAVVVVAGLGRRFFLVAAALVVVVAQLTFLLPELAAAHPVPAWVARAPTIRILDANVYNENRSMSGYASQILTVRPQLLTMEEANPNDVSQLRRAGVLTSLPYQFEVDRYDPFAFSRSLALPARGHKGRVPIWSSAHLPDDTGTALGATITMGRPYDCPSSGVLLAMAGTACPHQASASRPQAEGATGRRRLQRHVG